MTDETLREQAIQAALAVWPVAREQASAGDGMEMVVDAILRLSLLTAERERRERAEYAVTLMRERGNEARERADRLAQENAVLRALIESSWNTCSRFGGCIPRAALSATDPGSTDDTR